MLNYRPKVFGEASKAHTSKNIFIIIFSFIVVFIVILILESIIPAIVSWNPMQEELAKQDANSSMGELFQQSMEISSKVTAKPGIMIPTLLSTVFGTLAAIFYCRCIETRPVRSMGARKKGFFANYFTGLLVGAALMSAIVLMTKLTGAGSVKLCENVNYKIIALFFLGFVVQGMSEEFIFRGYLLTSIGGAGHHTLLAIMISAVGFGLAHAANPGFGIFPFFNLVLFGVFAALYLIVSDNIWGISAVHSIWNFTQGNVYGISVSGTGDTESIMRTTAISTKDYITGGKFGIEGSIFTTIALGVGIIVLLCLLNKKSKNTNAEPAEQPA